MADSFSSQYRVPLLLQFDLNWKTILPQKAWEMGWVTLQGASFGIRSYSAEAWWCVVERGVWGSMALELVSQADHE